MRSNNLPFIKIVGVLSFFAICLFTGTMALCADISQATNQAVRASVSTVGSNFRTWAITPTNQPRYTSVTNRPHQVTELATGMHYWNGQQWTPSNPSFEATNGGFAVSQTQHKVLLSSNIFVTGAVNVTTPAGIVLHSTPLGIGLYDAATGNFLLIGEITNSVGVQVTSNVVVFPNAFNGICANLVYTMHRGSFHQDVVFTGSLDPTAYGFPSNTTRIQVITEFYSAPTPQVQQGVLRVEKNQELRSQMVSPDFTDQTLRFGEFVLGRGRASLTGTNAPSFHGVTLGVPVGKAFNVVEGRQFLIESVEYQSVSHYLQSLPACNANGGGSSSNARIQKANAAYAALPAPPKAIQSAATGSKPLPIIKPAKAKPLPQIPARLAKAAELKNGFAIDYVATLNSYQDGDFTFRSDTTYYISDGVSCSGVMNFEGGTVIKFPDNSLIGTEPMIVSDSINCMGDRYRPIILTATDDDTVGDSMTNIDTHYTGNPFNTNRNGGRYLVMDGPQPFADMRFSFASIAITCYDSPPAPTPWNNLQFVNCGSTLLAVNGGDATTPIIFNNCLIANSILVINSTTSGGQIFWLNQCTLDGGQLDYINEEIGGGYDTFCVTNSIFANIGDTWSTFYTNTGDYNGFYNTTNFGSHAFSTNASPFQSVGAGNYYLATNTFQGKGTTNIDYGLLSLLQQRTTYPPLWLTTTFTNETNLFPQAIRDTNSSPDLGYHYDPIDYLASCTVSNATLTLTNGVVVGYFNEGAITLEDGSHLVSEGTAAMRNYLVDYLLVQEQPTVLWAGASAHGALLSSMAIKSYSYPDPLNAPTASLRFTTWSHPLGAAYFWYVGDGSSDLMQAVTMRDCEAYGCGGEMFFNIPNTISLTNNLFHRADVSLLGATNGLNVYNNTFIGSSLTPPYHTTLTITTPTNGTSAAFNNIFDGARFENNNPEAFGNNAYLERASSSTNASTDIVTNFVWQTGPLGDYYQPTNSPLLNKGNTNANVLDMANYTVLTNQAAEGISLIGIGYHYYSLLENSSASVSLLNPTNGEMFSGSTSSIDLSALTSSSNSIITNVQFFIDGTSLGDGTTNSNPAGEYSLNWTNVTVGWHTLTAWTWNNTGQSNSASINFDVDCEQASLSVLSFSGSPTSNGIPITGTITLSNSATAYGQVVTFGSDNTNVIPPLSVLVAGGQSSTNFTIQTLPVTSNITVHVWASYHDQSLTNTVTLDTNYDSSLPVMQSAFSAYTLTTVASGFPNDDKDVGPVGMVINNLGQLMVSMPNEPFIENVTAIYILPSDSDGQSLTETDLGGGNIQITGATRVAYTNFQIMGLTRVGNRIYGSYNDSSNSEVGVVELSDDGITLSKHVIAGAGYGCNGLTVNPQTGHLCLSIYAGYGESAHDGQIIDVDPVTWVSASLASPHLDEFDGISVALDGRTVFVAEENDGPILGFDTSTAANVYNIVLPPGSHPDGAGIGQGTLAGELFVNCNDGELWEIDLATGAQNLVFSGVSRGDFVQVDINNGSLLITQSDRILRLTPPPGGSFGPSSGIICTRNDSTTNYSSITLSNALLSTNSAQATMFDLRGISGAIRTASFSRADSISYNSGSDFDLELGFRLLTNNTLTNISFGLPTHYLPTPSSGVAGLLTGSTWSLSPPNLIDVQLGTFYQVNLVDRISSACATFCLTNQPQADWPHSRNTLILFAMDATNPQIPQGDCLDISMNGSSDTINGNWQIVLNNTVVASSGNPNGWDVEDDHNAPGTGLNGDIVTVPTSAAEALGYEVIVGGATSRVGRFDVVRAGSVDRAATLMPLSLSTNEALASGSLTMMIALDHPAPPQGAAIVLSCSDSSITLPAYIIIPAGGTTSNVTISLGGGASTGGYALTASYNGLRYAAFRVRNSSGSAPSAPTGLSASASAGNITLSWGSVSSALSYNVKRSLVSGSDYVTIFSGLITTNYSDTQVINGVTYYYVVSAVNDYGEGSNSSQVSATPTLGTVATPAFSTLSTTTTNVLVGLTDSTVGAFMYYTLDGSEPTQGSTVYSTPISLIESTTIKAKAFKAGYFPSVIATTNFIVTARMAGSIICGEVTNDYLGIIVTNSSTNVDYSWFKGQGYFAQHYQISVPDTNAGGTMTITMSSGQLDSFIYLTDGSYTNILASNDNDYSATPNSRITYTIPSNSTVTNYYIESTTAVPGETGNFVLFLDCGTGTPQIGASGVQFDGQTGFTASTNPSSPANLGALSVNKSGMAILTINNAGGTGGLDIQRLTMTGDFIISPRTLPALAIGQSTNLSIMPASLTAGTKAGALTIANNTTTNPLILYFTASITNPPALTINGVSATTDGTYPGIVDVVATIHSEDVGLISKMEFFASQTIGGTTNTIKIGQGKPVTPTWFQIPWQQPSPGTYTITAVATDYLGNTVSSTTNYTSTGLNSLDTQGMPTITPSSGIYTNQVQVAIGWTYSGTSSSSPLAGSTVLFTTETNASPRWYIYNTNYPFILTTNNGVWQSASNNYVVNLQVRAIESGYSPGSTTNATYYIFPGPTNSPSGFYPLAEIASPTNGSVMTGPTNLTGIAALDPSDTNDVFGSWLLEYRLSGSPGPWTAFGNGTSAVGSSGSPNQFGSVVFDPTVLLNGLYDIRLTVADNNGDTSTCTTTLLVQGKQKVGNFTISFVDLSVPVAGVPLQVTRTYDSRDKGQGDFGIGWRLSVNSVQIQQSGTLGTNWVQEVYLGEVLETFALEETIPGSHLVTITFPGDVTYSFEAALDPSSDPEYRIEGGTVIYNPLPGTQATLAAVGDNDVTLSKTDPGDERATLNTDAGTYDPDQFLLTTHDGRVFLISMSNGLESITDLNGNVTRFQSDGIYKTTAAVGGTGTNIVSYLRETNGLLRITNIFLTSDGSGKAIHYTYGTSGSADALNLLQVTDRMTNTTTFAYDSRHYLTDIYDPAHNHAVQTTYDDSGRITQTVDAQNNVTSFGYSPPMYPIPFELITNALGTVTWSKYDANGNITNNVITSADNSLSITTISQFADPNNPNKPTMTVDPLGRTNYMSYSPSGDLLSTIDPLGNTTTYAYNGFGQITSIKDARDIVTVQNQYDKYGNLISSTDALGAGTTNGYNRDGTLASTADAYGNVTSYYYGDTGADPGGTGQPTRVYDASGHQTSNWYDNAGNKTNSVTTRTLIDGSTQTITSFILYDENSRVTNTIINGQSQGQTVYNNIGKVDHTLDANNQQTSFVYDEIGRLVQTITPDGLTNITEFDPLGRQTATTDKAGNRTQSVYDGLGRQIATIYPGGAYTTNLYDLAGQLTNATDANGNTTKYFYDDAGRKTKVTDALGHSTIYEYDEIGNQTSVTDANNNQTLYDYDDAGRLTTTTFPDSTTQITTYDSLGQKIAQTDQATNTTQFGYDALGRLVSVTNALNKVTLYAYDEVGNQTNQVDALNHQTIYEYDALSRRIKRTLPGGQYETFGYDAAGNMLSHTDFNGLVITNNYDVMNRILGRWNGTTNLEAYTYDALGQLTNRTDTSGSYAWVFDNRGRLTNSTTPVGTLNYTYDANGNQTSLASATSGGVNLTYQYDALNRLINVLDANLGMTVTNTAYTYDVVGNLQTLKYPNQVTNLWQYDSLNRLTNLVSKLNSTNLGSFYYQIGPTGNRTNLTETVNTHSRGYSWWYDSLYRLTNETISGAAPIGIITNGYDAVGNRTIRYSEVAGINGQTFTFNSNDWLNSDGYDTNGNTTTNINNQVYQYDYANRLTNFNAGSVTLVYDADGNRIQKKASGTTLYLVSDVNPTGNPQVVEEFTVSGSTTNLSKVYTYGLSLISQRVPGTSTNFFGLDGHGNTRFLTDAGGNIVNEFAYDAYGNLITSNSTPQTAYLYCGQQFDSDLGLYYLRARYMNPESGRFWTMDTYEGMRRNPSTLHKYTYCIDNPPNHVDSSGNDIDETLEVGNTAVSLNGVFPASAINVLGRGGPDITKALNLTLSDVSSTWGPWTPKQKRSCAGELYNDLMAGLGVFSATAAKIRGQEGDGLGSAVAWEINDLHTIGEPKKQINSLFDGTETYECGTGFWVGTAAFNNKVYHASGINYALLGRMFRLCDEYFAQQGTFFERMDHDTDDPWSEDALEDRIQHWKMRPFKFQFPWNIYTRQAVAFGRYGYNGTEPSSADAFPCRPSGKVYAGPAFDWTWRPEHLGGEDP